MSKQNWIPRNYPNFREYFLSGTKWFVSHPTSNAHAQAIGLWSGYRWMVYQAGAHRSGCAQDYGCFHTLKDAQAFVENIIAKAEATP